MQLAINGDQPTLFEWLVDGYYLVLETIAGAMKKDPSAKLAMDTFSMDLKGLREYKRQLEMALCSAFLDAVQKKDGQKILEIAEAVWTVKERRSLVHKDHQRTMLLLAKRLLDESGQKWTIQQVVKYLAEGKDLKSSEDGYSSIRRKCKEIDFPLAESRKTSRK